MFKWRNVESYSSVVIKYPLACSCVELPVFGLELWCENLICEMTHTINIQTIGTTKISAVNVLNFEECGLTIWVGA